MMKRRIAILGVIGGGVAAASVFAVSMSANAATPSSSPTSAIAHSPSSDRTGPPLAPHPPGRLAPNHTGTVTALTSSTVTIKEGSEVHTYQVTAASDIDKNGESSLLKLAVGDQVRFSVKGDVIDKLHAGDEAKDRPAGMPGGPGPKGPRPGGAGRALPPAA